MKLIIQIPCYNEADALPITLKTLPREVKGFQKVEWLIIDDGSTDDTVKVAKQYHVDHVVSLGKNKGLAEVFKVGLDTCVKEGADVIVNTDADNQYDIRDIDKLVLPILEGKADIVIGARPIATIAHFSVLKKILQKVGSWVVRKVSQTDITDAPSGYRAICRDAAMKLNVFNKYTYTLETIIQAGVKNLTVVNVPIRVNKDLRPSKLVKSISSYVKKSMMTIFRVFCIYKSFSVFSSLGTISFLMGVALGARWLVFLFLGTTRTRIPSLILTSIFILIGVFFWVLAFLADLISVNRRILEENQYRLRKLEADIAMREIKKKK